MSEILSAELQKTLERAYREAAQRRHEFVTVEHLLYALTFDRSACDILLQCEVDIEALGKDLKLFLDKDMEALPEADQAEPQYSLGFQYTLQIAIAHVQSAGKSEVQSANVLAAIYRERESHAVYFLEKYGATRYTVVRAIAHPPAEAGGAEGAAQDDSEAEGEAERGPARDPLGRFCVNLNDRAAKGGIDPLIGRESELERLVHILARRRKNNPVLVGDAGVGKTAIVEGLAYRIQRGEVPESLRGRIIFALDMGSLLAGTRFRGDFEERLKSVVDALKNQPGASLFIDEIHTIIGAGAVAGGALDASNIIKPALASGEISCIGATTYKEYRSIFEKDHALARRFQKIEVGEPSLEDCVAILNGLKKTYEEFHRVTYSASAIQAAVDLSARHITDRFLPDKAIDVLDESGARLKLKSPAPEDSERSQWPAVAPRDIEELVARIARVPARTVRGGDRNRLRDLSDRIKSKVFGQDAAVDQVVRAIQLARAGLGEADKPMGAFLFAGPTGVGKTELSRQLAAEMGVEFIRFDMSEYMEKHTVSRLIGSPPGYVGFDQGGQLTDAIIRHPHSVLLLDEIEKAHEDLYNILLQVMDYATLTDNSGRKADFRQVIVIMTTNQGAREAQQRALGFAQDHDANRSERSLRSIERAFSPEFRNRLTAIVQFQSLAREQTLRIVDRMVGELAERLKARKVQLKLEDSARQYLADRGFDPLFGARPIRRTIESEISHALSSEILFGQLAHGGIVVVRAEENALHFRFESRPGRKKAANKA
ncbi:MAG: ATP-dependent Clp protease ATP-binding subunit ClpA [Leptospirales bacterium]|nr:ATP-dependent Clp protease ATP-binding subunit ClpA [Leptospirales bacterium]